MYPVKHIIIDMNRVRMKYPIKLKDFGRVGTISGITATFGDLGVVKHSQSTKHCTVSDLVLAAVTQDCVHSSLHVVNVSDSGTGSAARGSAS